MNAILKIREFIEKILLVISVFMLCMVSVLIVLQVFFRSVGIGIDWTEEFARFAFVCLTFLGSVIGITKNRHIVIDFLVVLLPDIMRRWLLVLIHITMAGFMVICVYGMSIIMTAARGVPSNSVAWFHMNYLYAVVMLGCALMVFVSLVRALEYAFLNLELPPPQGT